MEDTRPLAEDEDTKNSCFCCPVTPALEVQSLRRIPLRTGPRKCTDIRFFVVVASFYTLCFVMVEYYLVGVITTLEKRFGFSSSTSGMLLSVKEIATVCVVALVSHFAKGLHRPRFLAVTGVLAAVGGFIFVLPHGIYGNTAVNSLGNSSTQQQKLLCRSPSEGNVTSLHRNITGHMECGDQTNKGAYGMFVLGSILIGVGAAPVTALTVTYVDDACGMRRTSLFLGFMYMMKPFGPVFAFIGGSVFTSIYETLHDPGFDVDDPRWIGAWWLGYLVFPGLLVVGSALLPLFPPNIPRDPTKDADVVFGASDQAIRAAAVRSTIGSVKDLFASIGSLLRNPVYMTLQIGGCLSAFVVSGLFPFIPKYLEVQFLLSASKANLLTGVTAALLAGVGVFLGGYIASRLHWTVTRCAAFVFLINTSFGLLCILLIFIRCPGAHIAPITYRLSSAGSDVSDGCAGTCRCSDVAYHPVCGLDSLTYLNPCHAGCTVAHGNKTWAECGCVGLAEGGPALAAAAQDGPCTADCRALVPFLILLSLGAVVLMLSVVPGSQVTLRCVEEKHRSLALGFGGMLTSLVSFVPGPMAYGAIIDSTCILWNEVCGVREDCLLYEKDHFGSRIFATTVAFKISAGILYFMTWMLLRRQDAKTVHVQDMISYSVDSGIVLTPPSSDTLHQRKPQLF